MAAVVVVAVVWLLLLMSQLILLLFSCWFCQIAMQYDANPGRVSNTTRETDMGCDTARVVVVVAAVVVVVAVVVAVVAVVVIVENCPTKIG